MSVIDNVPLKQLFLKLREHLNNGETKVCIDHDAVAAAFPKSALFDDRTVNWETLRAWVKSEGWDVRPLTEETPVEDRYRPYIYV